MRQWPEEISSKQVTASGLSSEATASSAPPFMRIAASPALPSRFRHARPGASGLLPRPAAIPTSRRSSATNYGFAFICAAVTDMRACQEEPGAHAAGQCRQHDRADAPACRPRDASGVSVQQPGVRRRNGQPRRRRPRHVPRTSTARRSLPSSRRSSAINCLPRSCVRPRYSPSHPVGVFKAWFEALAQRPAPSRRRPTWRSRRSWWTTSPGRPSGSPPDAIAASGISAPATR